MACFDQELLRSLVDAGYGVPLQLLQTLPGIDLIGAAMPLVEIGGDMSVFGSAQRLAYWVGYLSGQQRVGGQAQKRAHQKGQRLGAPAAV